MIDIKMPVLKKDHAWPEHIKKLKEESNELIEALDTLHYIQRSKVEALEEGLALAVVSETLDVIQMCIGILDKLMKSYPKILAIGVADHFAKLYSRGWIFKKWLNISED